MDCLVISYVNINNKYEYSLHVMNLNQNKIIESNRESNFGVDAINT